MSVSTLVEDAQSIFDVAVRRVQADRLLAATELSSCTLRPLDDYSTVRVAALGKAAMAMAGVVEARYVGRIRDGVAVVPEGYPDAYPDRLPRPSEVEVRTAGHPLPSSGSVRAGRRLREQAEAVGAGDLLLTLVSGGGTALSTLPAAALDLSDLTATYHQLLTTGVPIGPANAIRKHLTQVGGGQLAQAAHPADVVGLVVSDVVGDDLTTIASGPTVPDPTTYEDAMQALYRYGLWHDVPEAIRTHLASGARDQHPETPEPGANCFSQARTKLVGSNDTALQAARAAAKERGYAVRAVTADVTGEARDLGRTHARRLLKADVSRPTCWLWGGEPTVTVTGDGTGGRSQEAALAAARTMDGTERNTVFLSGGTDGIDGPTDAAGAWATPDTAAAARQAGLNPEAHLHDNNAYPFFDQLGQLLHLGPTHTNVMDVQIGLVRPAA